MKSLDLEAEHCRRIRSVHDVLAKKREAYAGEDQGVRMFVKGSGIKEDTKDAASKPFSQCQKKWMGRVRIIGPLLQRTVAVATIKIPMIGV